MQWRDEHVGTPPHTGDYALGKVVYEKQNITVVTAATYAPSLDYTGSADLNDSTSALMTIRATTLHALQPRGILVSSSRLVLDTGVFLGSGFYMSMY